MTSTPNGQEDAFEITEAIPMFLEDQGITPDGEPYDIATVVNVLKEMFGNGVHFPERDGGTVDAGVSRPEDSDGYRIMVGLPGQPFWLASPLVFGGNANGVAFEDFPLLVADAVGIANNMLHAWDEHANPSAP